MNLLTSVYLKWFLCSYEEEKGQSYAYLKKNYIKKIDLFKDYLLVSPLIHRSEGLLIFSLDFLLDWSDLCPPSHPVRKNDVFFII